MSDSLAAASGEPGIVFAARNSSLRTSPAVSAIACDTEAAVHEPPSTGACGSVESPKLTVILSSGRPSRSAAIARRCVGAGADVEERAGDLRVPLAVNAMRTAEGICSASQTPVPCPSRPTRSVAHRARLRVAQVPAEGGGALAITFAQLLAGIGDVLVLVAVRVAAQAQLSGSSLSATASSSMANRAHARRLPRRAPHVAGRRQIEPRQTVHIFAFALCRADLTIRCRCGKNLVLRGRRDRLVVIACSVPSVAAPSARRSIEAGPMAESVHLLARQHEAHRTLQRAGRQHRQHGFILRPQPRNRTRRRRTARSRADRPASGRRWRRDSAARSARPGSCRGPWLAVAVPHRRRRVQFHGIVMLGRDEVFRLVAHRGRRIGPVGIAARLFRLRHDEGLVALRLQVGDEVASLYSMRRSEAANALSPTPRRVPRQSAAR